MSVIFFSDRRTLQEKECKQIGKLAKSWWERFSVKKGPLSPFLAVAKLVLDVFIPANYGSPLAQMEIFPIKGYFWALN